VAARLRVNVRLFAVARQVAGRTEVVVEIDEPATVGDLRRALGTAVPELVSILPRLMIAVGTEYADDAQPLAADDDVAVIPPVSGGGTER
jgi:molybdopterin converting factor subunit 1